MSHAILLTLQIYYRSSIYTKYVKCYHIGIKGFYFLLMRNKWILYSKKALLIYRFIYYLDSN
jgi:hypothetical protein